MVLRNTEVIYEIILVKNAIYVCIDKITHWRVAPSALIPLIPEQEFRNQRKRQMPTNIIPNSHTNNVSIDSNIKSI
jgi:hypothetical protein